MLADLVGRLTANLVQPFVERTVFFVTRKSRLTFNRAVYRFENLQYGYVAGGSRQTVTSVGSFDGMQHSSGNERLQDLEKETLGNASGLRNVMTCYWVVLFFRGHEDQSMNRVTGCAGQFHI